MPKFHKDSTFGPGPRVPLSGEQRAVFKAKLKLQRRPGRITGACRYVGEALLAMLGPDGRLNPTIATIAAAAGIAESTVYEALKRLRECGFVKWTRRLVRNAATGWRAEQTSNAYVLLVPSCDSGFQRQVPLFRFKKAAQGGNGGWEEQVANATRLLEALGAPIPAVWGPQAGAILR